MSSDRVRPEAQRSRSRAEEGPVAREHLFVYGTLQPGEVRWPAIAELVEVIGPASTPGRVVATPMGWPAATFLRGSEHDGVSGSESEPECVDDDGCHVRARDVAADRVHGTLLRVNPGHTERLYRICDEIEGEGDRFLRVTIDVDGPDGWVAAAAYTWNHVRGRPPGDPLEDGKWVEAYPE